MIESLRDWTDVSILAGAFFTTYEGTKSLLTRLNPTTNSNKPLIPIPIIHSAASCVGELVSCFILTPAEVLKQNAQVVKRSTTDSSHAFDTNATRQAFKKFKKPTQLWRGYTALAARNLPFTAMQFPMFEHLKKSIMEYRQEHNTATGTLLEKAVVTGLSAGSAGSVAAVITTPIDVVKTRIMLGAASEEGGVAGEAARSAMKQVEAQGKDAKAELERAQQAAKAGRGGGFAVGKEILRTEGVKGLFRGGALRGAWTALGSGLYLSVYESGRTYLEGRRREKDDGRAVV